jgi:hypothetical protein
MFLTGGKESRTLRLTLVGSKGASTLATSQKWKEQHLIRKTGNLLWCRSQDNRAGCCIGALIKKIIACSQGKSNDLAAKIALMSVAVVLPSHLMERITIV